MPPRRRVVRIRDREAVERAAAELAGEFARAEQTIRERMAEQIAAGLAEHPDDVLRAVRLPQLRDAAASLSRALATEGAERVARIVAAAVEGGHAEALREIARVAGADLDTVRAALPNAPAAQAITLELSGVVSGAARGILRWPDDVYRRAVASEATQFLLGARRTSREAQAAAYQRLLSQGVTGFVDAAGRRWDAATYVEMATRTATRRAWDTQHEATMLASGLDLVTVIVGSDACRGCAQWAGKILRLDAGPVGWLTLPRADGPGDVRVFVDGTLPAARAEQGSHFDGPNCRCRTVAYLPGLSVPADATTYDPQAEDERDRLRYLERRVRAAKAAQGAAVTPEQRAAAAAKVRALQAQIREHVEATGLVRKRYRERVNLGLGA